MKQSNFDKWVTTDPRDADAAEYEKFCEEQDLEIGSTEADRKWEQHVAAIREKCDWQGHAAALDEAGWCPVCDEGNLDPEWAERHGMEV